MNKIVSSFFFIFRFVDSSASGDSPSFFIADGVKLWFEAICRCLYVGAGVVFQFF